MDDPSTLCSAMGRECHIEERRIGDVTISFTPSKLHFKGNNLRANVPNTFSLKNVLSCEYHPTQKKATFKISEHHGEIVVEVSQLANERQDSTMATLKFFVEILQDSISGNNRSDKHVLSDTTPVPTQSSVRRDNHPTTTATSIRSASSSVPGASSLAARQLEASTKSKLSSQRKVDLSGESMSLEQKQNQISSATENRSNGSNLSSAQPSSKKPAHHPMQTPGSLHGPGTSKTPVAPAPPSTSHNLQKGSLFNPPTPSLSVNNMMSSSTTSKSHHKPSTLQTISPATRPLPSSITSPHRTSLTSSPGTSSEYSGIRNTGNTCYINATLQALMALGPFVSDLGHERLTKLTEGIDLKSFYKAFLAIADQTQQKGRKTALDPNRVKLAIARNSERFRDSSQQDAHEFLVSLLSQLEMDLMPYLNEARKKQQLEALQKKRAALKSKKLQRRRPNMKLIIEEECEDAAGDETESEEDYGAGVIDGVPFSARMTMLCPSKRNFAGVMAYEFFCKGCEDSSTKYESIRCLTLDIFDNQNQVADHIISNLRGPKGTPLPDEERRRNEITRTYMSPLNIDKLLSVYFSPEVIERRCEKCSHNETILRRSLVQLPRVLIIHLKRFSYNAATASFQKLAWPVAISSTLDVQKWSAPSVQTAGPIPLSHEEVQASFTRSGSRLASLKAEEEQLQAMLKKEKEEKRKSKRPSSTLPTSTASTTSSSIDRFTYAGSAATRGLSASNASMDSSSTSVSIGGPRKHTPLARGDSEELLSSILNDGTIYSKPKFPTTANRPSAAAPSTVDGVLEVDDADDDESFLHISAFGHRVNKKPKLEETPSNFEEDLADLPESMRMEETEPRKPGLRGGAGPAWLRNTAAGHLKGGYYPSSSTTKRHRTNENDNDFPETCDSVVAAGGSTGPSRASGISTFSSSSASNPDMDASMSDMSSFYGGATVPAETAEKQKESWLGRTRVSPSASSTSKGGNHMDVTVEDNEDDADRVDLGDIEDIIERAMWEQAVKIANGADIDQSSIMQTDLPSLSPGPATYRAPVTKPSTAQQQQPRQYQPKITGSFAPATSSTTRSKPSGPVVNLDEDDEDDELKKAMAASMTDTGRKPTMVPDEEDEDLQRILRETAPSENHYNTADFFGSDDESATTEMIRDEYEGDEIAPPVAADSKPTVDPPRPPSSYRYSLQSVVHHLGSSANSGHYIAQVCQDLARASEQGHEHVAWKTYDDARVSPTEYADVCRRTETVYMLFYVHESVIKIK